MNIPAKAERLVPAGFLAAGLVLCLLAAAGAPASAQSTGALYACASMTDSGARLACFDAEVARLKAAEAGGEVAVVTREEVKEAERDSFGLTGAQSPSLMAVRPKVAAEKDKLDAVTVSIVTIQKKPDGKRRFFTADGQVWVQTDTQDVRAVGDGPWRATIKSAMLGSFMLKLEGGRAIRAQREK